MDAYDIFKKLTKGLKFNNKLLGPKIESHLPKVPKNEPEPLDELLDEEIIYNSEDDHSSGSEHEDTAENGFELLQGVKIGPKKKKRKIKERSEELKNKLKVQEENHFRNQHGIRVVGRHIPAALPDFSILIDHYQVSEAFVNTIKDCGYAEPTPIQRQVLTCMLENRQILACAPTGSGKTAAFLIPILHMLGAPQGGPRALILCPTRELAKQIYREALRLSASTNLRCSVVNKIQESKIKERESTIKKSDIVISTPNRLCYLLNIENINITLDKVKWLIVDEADKMFEGSAEQDSDFRQQLEQIMTRCGGRERRMAMFSATHTPAVGKWCRHNLRGLINITVGQRNAATDLVDQELLYCGNESGKLVAFRQLVQQGLKPPVLVFVQSKDRAKQLFKELIYDGINVDVIHADRTQTQRDNVVRSFRIGKIWVLICTELMGRGIDFRGVNLVINFDFPPTAISYIHRIGRAGRAGQRGKAITFFTQDDVVNLRSIAAVMKQSGCDVPEYMLKLKQDSNKRKKLTKRAPHRDKISTILEKKPDKRKLEDVEKQVNEKDLDKPKRKRKKLDKKPNYTNKGTAEGQKPHNQKNNKKIMKNRKPKVKNKL